jgi:hypothetical protein
MQQDTVIALPNPWSTLSDPLTEVLRRGAQQLLAQAVEAEVATLLALYADRHDNQGRKAIVRNGYLPEREVQTGIGSVPVKVPRVRDRSGSGLRFHSMILPPYLRRSPSLETLLPWLYLQGISTSMITTISRGSDQAHPHHRRPCSHRDDPYRRPMAHGQSLAYAKPGRHHVRTLPWCRSFYHEPLGHHIQPAAQGDMLPTKISRIEPRTAKLDHMTLAHRPQGASARSCVFQESSVRILYGLV